MKLPATLTFNTVYRVLNMVVALLIVVLVSKLAGVAQYGLLSLMVVNATIFNLLSAFGIDAGITWHSAGDKLSPGKIVSLIFITIAGQMLVLGLVEWIHYAATGYYWLFKNNRVEYWWIGLLFLLSVSLTEKYTALFNGHHLFVLCSKILLYTNLIILAAFAGLFFYFPGYDAGRLAMLYVLLYLLQSVVLVILFHRRVKTASRLSFMSGVEIRAFLSFSMVTLITNAIQFLAYRMDYWFIEYYRGDRELGWYSLSVRLAQVFWVLPLLFAAILFPLVAREQNRYNDEQMLSFTRGLFFFNLLAGMLAFVLARWGILWVFGEAYSESILLFRILLPGIILFCPTTILAAWFAGKGKLGVNLRGSCICFACVVLLDILLVPRWGMKGASIASSIGYTITTVYFAGVYCLQTHTPVHKLFFFRQADWRYFRQAFNTALIKKAR